MTSIVSAFSGTQKTRKPSGTCARGFSLIELMVAMAMACIVLAAVYSLHAALMKSYTTQNVAADAQETMRAGIDLMAEDILMAGFDPRGTGLFGITEATDTSLRFTSDRNMNGVLDRDIPHKNLEEIRYFIDSQLKQELYYKDNTTVLVDNVQYTGGTRVDELVDNVTSLKFEYFDGAGVPIPPGPTPPPTVLDAAQRAAIRTIEVSMTVQAPAGRDKIVERTYTTRFRIRNLDL